MIKNSLIKILRDSKTKTGLPKKKKKKKKDIKKYFNRSKYKFYKSSIKEIRKNLYNIKNSKNLPESKVKKIGKNIFELEVFLSLKNIMIMAMLNV